MNIREKYIIMKVELNSTARKQFHRLNEPYLSRITAALDKLEREPLGRRH
ncbi:MAG: hypothetical protein FWC36_10590 [Spirochaetes bacterium]|nr:hypothetical protein [Spirochaetota bacterium]